MALEKKPFVNYGGEAKTDTISIRLNEEERELLNSCKMIIEQPKDGTALKTLMRLGANVLHDQNTSFLLTSLFKNKKNNYRTGVNDFD